MKKLLSLITCSLLLVTTPIEAHTISEDIDSYSLNEQVDNSNVALSQNSIDFLNEHGIDLTEELKSFEAGYSPYASRSLAPDNNSNIYIGNLESDINVLIKTSKAYNFTDEQIQAYVDGLMKNIGEVVSLPSNEYILPFSAPDRREETPGCGFEAESYSKFNLFTSYIQLPSVSINTANEIGYLFVGGTLPRNHIYFDFGLRKGQNHWQPFIMISNGNSKTTYDKNSSINLYDGQRLYIYVNYDLKNNTLTSELRDANDLSNVIVRDIFYPPTKESSNLTFNKQITMTWVNRNTNSSKFLNGKYIDAYLYSPTQTIPFENAINNNHYGTFGTTYIPNSRNFTSWSHYKQYDSSLGRTVPIDDVSVRLPYGYN